MLSKTFSFMIVVSFACAMITGNLENMGREFAESLTQAVSLCISILGMMCFWSGLMNVLRESGALRFVSKLLSPLMKLIYGKNNLSSESLENLSASVSANFLGLGNAALPLGIKTVKDFEKNNRTGNASDSTIMFAVLNTVPFQLIPTTLIALRSKYGSVDPFDVIPYIWVSSIVINIFAIVICKLLSLLWRKRT